MTDYPELDDIIASVKYSEKGGIADQEAKAKLEALMIRERVDELRNVQLPTNMTGIEIARKLEKRIKELEQQLSERS